MRKPIHYIPSLLMATAMIFSCSKSAENKNAGNADEKTMSAEDMVARGKYLVSISGCNDCHTPKIMTDQGPSMDMSKMLSGHPAGEPMAPYDKTIIGAWILFSSDLTAYVGPWGVTYSANLTPHESGIGNWTEENFLNAIRNGKHLGMDNQRPIMPPMPWQEIKNMTDEDLKSVFAFLKTIPPIDNVVPAYMPPGM